MLSRRAFVGRVAAGAAVACTIGAGQAGATPTTGENSPGGGETAATSGNARPSAGAAGPPPPSGPSAPPPWALLAPLHVGAPVAHGWRVSELSAIEQGSSVLTLTNERGRAQRIHLCRNAGRPQGLVHTRQLDLLVMNDGQGEQPTEESLAQAVAAVARVLAANEGRQAAVLSTLLPHAQRIEQFASAARLR